MFRYYFAYLGASEAFDPDTHDRDDEHLLSIVVEQEESEAAVAKIGLTYREGSYIALGSVRPSPIAISIQKPAKPPATPSRCLSAALQPRRSELSARSSSSS